jgi:hypothetical protein
MRAIAISFLVVLFGCAGGAPTSSGDDDGEPPPKIKEPPMPKDGSSTAPGCDGIPESGACKDGVATYCEITDGNGELRRKDCRALGKSCIMDGQRGAMCEVVEGPGPGGGGSGPASCDGVTAEGSCSGQVATWCDPETASIIRWDCAAETNSECTVIPNLGAYCTDKTPAPPPTSTSDCPALGFYGECDGEGKARWCNGDTLVEKVCSGGQTCQLDACADGAFCCTPPTAPPSECDTIGIRGICKDETHPRWCSGGTPQEVTCAAGKTCQIDKCGDGAFCCDP